MTSAVITAPLVGRGRELGLVHDLLEAARRGEGSALLFSGEPGSGKTALLAAARALAHDFTVVSCRGVEWEAELPYGGLHELIAPLTGAFDALPDPQRDALSGALGLSPSTGHQPLHLFAGTLSVLAEATRERPVLVIVDDLHWLDSTTAEVLAFIARRLGGESLSLLVATRPGADLPGLPTPLVALDPLDRDGVVQLAGQLLGRPLPDGAARDLAQASGGNPLAVVESVRHLGDELWLRGSLLDAPLPVGELIERGFSGRLADLPDATRAALDVVAAAIDPGGAVVRRALEAFGIPADALAEAERAEIISLDDGTVQFTHPLLRSLVHRRCDSEQLRRCHAALAVAHDEGSELRAWHVAGAATEPDEVVAEALDVAAERFAQRGGSLASSQALARAAALTPDAEVRAGRLLRAGSAAYRAGHGDRAQELFAAARIAATDPRTQLHVDYWEATRAAHTEALRDTVADFDRLVERAKGVDDDLRALAVSSLASEVLIRGSVERIDETAEALRTVLAIDGLSAEAHAEVQSLLGQLLSLTGTTAQDVAEGAALLRATADRRTSLVMTESASAIEGLVWIEEHDRAERLSRQYLDHARSQGDTFLMIGGLWASGYRLMRVGRWIEARGQLEASLRVARTTGQDSQAAVVQATLAIIQAGQGDDGFTQLVPEIESRGRSHGNLVVEEFLGAAIGLQQLGEGRPVEAVAAFGRAIAWQERSGQREPAAGNWPVDLIEASILAGDLEGARRHLTALRERTAITGRRWAKAAIARLDGLLEVDFDAHFERSLTLGLEAQDAFGQARTQLAYGRRLRRERRRIDARNQLAAALAAFEGMGARPWAEQARRELEASGATLRRSDEAAPEALTPQERQVAELVVGGASNKEVAAVMFLSPKTIESHLSRIYRKLGVASRTQLGAQLRAG